MRVRTDYYKMAQASPQDALRQRQMAESKRYKLVHRMPYGKICPLFSVLCPLASVILAVMTAGCAVSEKNPSLNYVATASDNPAESFADEDFDFLEEEFDEQMVEIPDPLEPLNRLMYNVNDILYF